MIRLPISGIVVVAPYIYPKPYTQATIILALIGSLDLNIQDHPRSTSQFIES
jgi:hypothetical protein